MKIFFILILSVNLLYAQDEAKKEKSKEIKFNNITPEYIANVEKEALKEKKVMQYFMHFMKKEYLEKAEKNLPKLEKELEVLVRKHKVANNQALKKKIETKIKEKKAEIEVEKMWKLYYQAFLIKENAYGKDDKRYFQALTVIVKIQKRYTELTTVAFPDPEYAFKEKYKKQLQNLK